MCGKPATGMTPSAMATFERLRQFLFHNARPKNEKSPKASCAKQTVWGFIAVDVRTLSPHANSIVRNKKPHVPRKRKS